MVAAIDIGLWLRSLNLEEYEVAFRESGISAEVLARLTEGDIERLDIPIDDRRRLLAAVRELRGAAPNIAAAERIGGSPTEGGSGEAAPQQRHLTVMFSDLAHATALWARLDLEDMREVTRAYQNVCSRVIGRHDGFVARSADDGILAYFGYPHAREDVAEQAVRAGLDLVAEVGRLTTPAGEPLAARVAIASGTVVVADLFGESLAREQAVIGETPNLAARLLEMAEPGTVAVAAATRRLLGSVFALRPLGNRQLKGFAEPVAAWGVEGRVSWESRFEAVHSAGLTAFTNREREQNLLLARKAAAWDSRGQVLLISGEPGIGKSRLAAWLGEQLKSEPHFRLLYQCSPYHQDSALYPFIQQLKRAGNFEPNDRTEQQLDKLEQMLALTGADVVAVAPLFASLLSIPGDDRYPPLQLSPARHRIEVLAALLDQLEGLARQKPTLLIFEDIHWADATSLELFDLAVERIRRLPILAIATSRSEFEPSWAGRSHVTSVALDPLDGPHVRMMVGRVARGRDMPAEVLDHILAKTDGVPLFVEELTKNLMESGLLREQGDGYALSHRLPPRALPSTLQDSLLARLDRLGSAPKDAAQVAAVVGREFSYGLLEAAANMPEERLYQALASLVEAGLLRQEGSPPQARYAFRHALIADSAYSTLLRSRRRQLHGRIAHVLERSFPDIAGTQPELVAHHLTEGGLIAAAVDSWKQAGLLALRRGAYLEGTRHLGRAIELLGSLPPEPTRDRREMELRLCLRLPLLIAKGYGTADADPNYERLEQLAESLGAIPEMLSALNGRCIVANMRCDFPAMTVHARRLISLAQRHSDSNGTAIGYYHLAAASQVRGEMTAAHADLGRAEAHHRPDQDELCRERYNFDVGPSLASLQCLNLQQSGLLDQARSLALATLADARRNPSAATQFIVLRRLAFLYMIDRDVSGVEQLVADLERLVQRHDGFEWLTHAALCSAWIAARSPEPRRESRVPSTMAGGQSATLLFAPIFLLEEAELLIANECSDEALQRLDLARRLIDRTGQSLFKPEADRLRAKAMSSDPDAAEEVEAHFATALDLARRSGMRLWEIRAAVSCAEFWRNSGRSRQAERLLQPVYASFTEGLDRPDLRNARMLLDCLRSS